MLELPQIVVGFAANCRGVELLQIIEDQLSDLGVLIVWVKILL